MSTTPRPRYCAGTQQAWCALLIAVLSTACTGLSLDSGDDDPTHFDGSSTPDDDGASEPDDDDAADGAEDDDVADDDAADGDAAADDEPATFVPPLREDGGTGSSDIPPREDCWDGTDNDRNGAADCAEAMCSALASCCWHSGCCSPDITERLESFAADACVEGSTACPVTPSRFGPRAPSGRADGPGLLPNGNDESHSGLVLDASLGLDQRWVMRVALSAPGIDQCQGDCLEVVGAGLLPPSSETGASPSLAADNPVVAVVVSAARGEALLLAGTEILAAVPVSSGLHDYELEFDPSGQVELRVDSGELSARSLLDITSLGPFADFAVFGRNASDLEESQQAYIGDVELLEAPCDVPLLWREIQLLDGADHASELSFAENPSGESLVAYTFAGEILGASSPEDLSLADGVLVPPTADAFWFSHPEVVWQSGLWEVYFSVEDLDFRTHIARTSLIPGAVAPIETILSPTDHGVEDLYAPSVLQVNARRLVSATADSDTGQQILLFEEVGAAVDSQRLDAGAARGLMDASVTPGGDRAAIDAGAGSSFERLGTIVDLRETDFAELGTSELIAHNGTYQLYFSASNLGRRAIQLWASDDLAHWRDLGEVLSPTEETTFLGAQHPDVFVADDQVVLYFTELRGDGSGIARARRPTTSFLGLPQ